MLKKLFYAVMTALFISTIFLSCGEREQFQFAWLSDIHIGATTSVEDLRLTVKDINSLEHIDFTVISGDVTESGSNEEFELAKAILDSLNKPYFIIPGNHDTKWSESGCTKFIELWDSDKFNFEYSGIRFLGMHQGPVMRMGPGHFAPEDIRWLDNQLQMIDKDQPLIFVTHYPLNSSISNWYEVLDWLKQYRTVAVLFGHGHRNKEWNLEGVPGVMGRSPLRRDDQRGGYNLVEIESDSIFFRERITGNETKSAWHKLPLVTLNYSADTTEYKRPDFSGNQRYPHIQIKWTFDTDFTIAAAPAVWKDYVVAGNSDGRVYCLSLKNGHEFWNFKADKSVFSTPDISEGRVVFGSSDKNIYCLNVASGNLLWKFKTKASVVASPAIENDIVYIGGSDNTFRAINLANGELIWEYNEINDFIETKPLIYRDKVIFGAWDNFLYALNKNDGSLAWKWSGDNSWKLVSPAACWSVGAHGKIFIVAPDRYMTAIDAETGETIWRTNRYKVRESIGISEDRNTVFAKCMQDTIIAMNAFAENPQARWVKDCGFGYDINPSMPTEKDGVVFFSTQTGHVYALDAQTGQIEWKYRTGVALLNTVVPISNDQVVVTDMDGRVMLVEKVK